MMAGLALAHGVAAAVLLLVATGVTVPTVVAYGGVALVIAVPQAFGISGRGFTVACGVAAALVLGAGLLLAFGGGVLFWPAALPLLLAAAGVTTRRALLITAAVLAVPWVALGVFQLF